MGRQLGVVQYRGKLGQTVGMKNGFGGSQAFNREYVATNSSESDAQINRRLRMLPAVNFRRQLDELISRGWQGVKYGGPTNRKFMQSALLEPLVNIPQLEKGDTRAIPGEYLIAKGSLAQVDVNALGSDGTIETTLSTGLSINPTQTTVDALTADLIENNTYLQEGDQLTFIRVSSPNNEIPYCLYEITSFQLDNSNTDTLANTLAPLMLIDIDGALGVDAGTGILLAGAVVVSREGATPKRSTSRMTVDKTKLLEFFGNSVKPNVKQSYKKTTSATVNSNWPYDPNGDTEDTGFVTIGVTVTPTGGGTVTGAGTYAKGDSVTLQATAASGYGFGHWELNGVEVGTTRTLQITANANAQYTAEFLPEG